MHIKDMAEIIAYTGTEGDDIYLCLDNQTVIFGKPRQTMVFTIRKNKRGKTVGFFRDFEAFIEVQFDYVDMVWRRIEENINNDSGAD